MVSVRRFLFSHGQPMQLALACVVLAAWASAQNTIERENSLPGSPSSEWDINASGVCVCVCVCVCARACVCDHQHTP